MSKVFIKEVFELLSSIRAVDSESEFSKDWLGRSECYLRTLRFKQKEPSVGTLAICASKLQHYGKRMILKEEHKRIGDQFLWTRCRTLLELTRLSIHTVLALRSSISKVKPIGIPLLMAS